jgi:DNA-binding MarR family transcriptional regulator
MNKTVELVTKWTAFEEQYPASDIEDFCRFLLVQKKATDGSEKLFGGKMIPPRPALILLKLLGRIMWYYSFYAEMAIEGLHIKRVEEFYFLNYIFQMKEPIKTDVIYEYMHTFSTGLSILDGLIAQGYISETDDMDDKRSKRVCLTANGEKVLSKCYERFSGVAEVLTFHMPLEDTQLCTQLLKPIDNKFTGLWKKHKGSSFTEVYKEVTGKITE